MPRVEIVPAGYDPAKGDGTPTVDVCRRCVVDFVEGEPLLEGAIAPEYGIRPVGATVGSVDVIHPPYADTNYRCTVCDQPLTTEDD